MKRLGFERVVDVVQLLDGSPVAARLHEDPTDREALAVHADWLLNHGEDWGAWVSRSLAGEDLSAVLHAQPEVWLEPLRCWQGTYELTWNGAYVDKLVLREGGATVDAVTIVQALLAMPALALVRSLDLACEDVFPLMAILAQPALRELRVRRCRLSRHSGLDLTAFGERYAGRRRVPRRARAHRVRRAGRCAPARRLRRVGEGRYPRRALRRLQRPRIVAVRALPEKATAAAARGRAASPVRGGGGRSAVASRPCRRASPGAARHRRTWRVHLVVRGSGSPAA